mmetsp:Transcript_42881/g.119474  ORF Transcript_42881/g.119474 Transcript_42881/m.119474 type:complete len:102 (+) Transcript_42881:57-362(+)
MKGPAAAMIALAIAAAVLPCSARMGTEASCKEQSRFDVIMCSSWMCTECDLQWCMEKCQEVQTKFATCACEGWVAGTTYSQNMKHAGKFGDVGEYGAGEFS